MNPPADIESWLQHLTGSGEVGALLSAPQNEQIELGYGHTLREICQQPATWLGTAARLGACRGLVAESLQAAGIGDRSGSIVLTGSGSSLYAGECVAVPLQEAFGVPVSAVNAGQLLTHPRGSLPPSGPFLVVSFARSGNSPESRAVVTDLLAQERASQLLITCSRDGALASNYRAAPRVRTVVLDESTNDKSLAMTSSFTNMTLAARLLSGIPGGPQQGAADASVLAASAAAVLSGAAEPLREVARSDFRSVLYLGSGCRLGAAREAALKMLEMTGGRVHTMAESYLGLRHGPMSAVHDDSLVVAFLSSDPMVRAYEIDLICELEHKRLGQRRVVVGAGVPAGLTQGARDLVVDFDRGAALADGDLPILDVLVGQLLAFFRCRHEGLRPDSPSDGVISRVVESFPIHSRT